MKALFLDRDGVINLDNGYVSKIKDFVFIDGVFEALRGFLELGFTLFVVTNQSGIGRGYYTLEDFLHLNEFMLNELKKEQISVKKVYFCPHAPEVGCLCRKPNTKMIEDARLEFDIDLANSIMIGDKDSDIEAAKNAKIGKSYKVGQEFANLYEIYKFIKAKL